MLKSIISIFMTCMACCAVGGEQHESYMNGEIRAFTQTLTEWKPVLERLSEELSKTIAPGDLTSVQVRLSAYDAVIESHYEVAEYIVMASGHMYTEAELYRLPLGFRKGVWGSKDLKEIIDDRIALIRRTLESWPESPGNPNNAFPA